MGLFPRPSLQNRYNRQPRWQSCRADDELHAFAIVLEARFQNVLFPRGPYSGLLRPGSRQGSKTLVAHEQPWLTKLEAIMPLLRRKRNFVDFEVQTSLLRRMALQWISFLIVNALALYGWTYLVGGADDTVGAHMTHFLQLYLPVLIVSLALLPVFLLDAAKLSNRFVGPILRVRRALAEAATGAKVKPLHFRENDFWRSLADDLNNVLNLNGETPATEKKSP